MTRETLPDRRRQWTQTIRIGDQTFHVSFGEHADGRLGEIFVVTSKEGSFTRGVIDGFARMASLALQCGSPPPEVGKIMRGMNFPPNGEVKDVPGVQVCSSVIDCVGQIVENVYGLPAPKAEEAPPAPFVEPLTSGAIGV